MELIITNSFVNDSPLYDHLLKENRNGTPMTSPDSITVSLDMARKLKEAGWEHRTVFSATVTGDTAYMILTPPEGHDLGNYPIGDPNNSEIIMFPTCDEILRRLPLFLVEGAYRLEIRSWTEDHPWCVLYAAASVNVLELRATHGTLSSAAAAMWLYLKENNLLPPEK
jgi:hypothetical protein